MTSSDPTLRDALMERLAREGRAGSLSPLADYLASFPSLNESEVAERWQAAKTLSRETAGEPVLAAIGPGQRLGGFTLIREIGRGGQAAVWLALGDEDDREIALKILEAGATRRTLDLFRREAEIAAALNHPNVCPLLDAGFDGGVAWIAMPFVAGTTLAARLVETDRSFDEATLVVDDAVSEDDAPAAATPTAPPDLPTEEEIRARVRLIEKAARALHACHEAGVVHRDVKPGNLMVTPEDEPVILDFGLARQEEDSGRTVTLTGELFGTPAYLSPEQLAVKRIRLDRRTDVYSLGATLYESLTRRRPFEAPTRDALYQAIMTKEAMDPRRLNRAVSRELSVVIARAMEKDRDRRYATAAGFADELAAILEGRPITARAPGPLRKLGRWARREPALAALLAVLLVSLPLITTLAVTRAIDAPRLEQQRRLDLEEAKDERLALANLAQDRGDLAEASQLFEAALGMEGGSPEAATALISIRLRQGETARARELLEGLSPALRKTRAVLTMEARLLREAGEGESARRIADALPRPTETIDLLLTAAGMGRAAETQAPARARATARAAVSFLQQGLARLPRPRLVWTSMLAHVAGHALDPVAARIAIDALDAHWPKSRAARDWAAFAAMRLGWHGEAERQAQAALRLAPRNARAHALLGHALHRQNRSAEAVASFEAAIRLAPQEAEYHTLIALALRGLGRFEAARAALHRALEIDADHVKALNVLADLLADREERQLAIKHYRRALALAPWDAVALSNLGETLRLNGDVEAAIKALRRAIALDRDFAVAHSNLAVALNDQGDPEGAERAARRAVALDTDSPNVHGILARIERDRGALEASLATTDVGLTRYPDDWILNRERGITLRALGRTEEALASFRRALEISPRFWSPWCDIGLTLGDAHRHVEAEAAFQKALAMEPEASQAHAGLGNIAYLQGDLDASTRHYRRAAELDGNNPKILKNLGVSLRRQGRADEAAAILRRLVALKPEDHTAWVNLGIHHFRRRELEAAAKAYEAALKAAPDDASVHYHRGILLAATGELGGAIIAYRRAIACDPEYAQSYCNLAAQLEARGQVEEALRLMRRGHRLGSKQADWNYPSGQWVRRIEGRVAEKARVEGVLDGSLARPRGERLARLAQSAIRVGRPAAAALWFEAAFAQEPALLAQPVGVRITATQAALQAARAWAAQAEAPAGDPAAWRARALRWMEDELAALLARVERGRLSEGRLEQTLSRWAGYPFLAEVRDAAALDRLPEAEARAWRRFWQRCAQHQEAGR